MRRFALFALVLLAAPSASPAASNETTASGSRTAGCVRSDALPVPSIERTRDRDVPITNEVIVSPASFEFEAPVEARDRYLCTLTLRNRYPTRVTLQLEPQGLLGARTQLATAQQVDADHPDADATAIGWLQARPDEVTLEPRGVVEVPVVVEVPEDPPTGGVYGTIDVVSRSDAPAGETNLGIETRVAVPFLFDVGGTGAPNFTLSDGRAPKLRWSRDPWTLRANLQNDGTLHATPRGRVRLRSIFGNTVHQLPIDGRPLLPGGRQRIETTWNDVPWFGFYRWDLRIAPADERHASEVVRASGWFLALPPWWVLALAALVLVLAIGSWARRRRLARSWDADEVDDDGDPEEFD